MKQRYDRKTGKKRGWTCNPCATQKVKQYRVANPEKTLDNKLWTFYRIRLADYNRMLEEQGFACAACGAHRDDLPLRGGFDGTGLVIDHDHRCCPSTRLRFRGLGRGICGKCVRGLLCSHCNVALGMAGDDPLRLKQLLAYLERSQ